MKPLGAESPVSLLLLILLVSVGLPFFAVSTTAPLLQRWHSRQSSSLEGTYRLYALSNAASFLALLSYPFGIERLLDLPQQARVWTAMFALFAVGCGVIAWRCARQSETAEMADDLRASSDSVASNVVRPANLTLWILLSFVGAATYLATTNQLTQDVAAVPLLWVLPLAIYLLSFVLCFDRPQWYSRRWTLIVAGVTSGVVMFTQLSIQLRVLTSCAFLFAFCVLCQGELERLKPGSRRLTLFYLLIAFGGALGGTFVGIGAPLLFRDLWEFQIVVVAGWFAVAFAWWLDRTSPFHTGDRWLFAWLVAVGTLGVGTLCGECGCDSRELDSWSPLEYRIRRNRHPCLQRLCCRMAVTIRATCFLAIRDVSRSHRPFHSAVLVAPKRVGQPNPLRCTEFLRSATNYEQR